MTNKDGKVQTKVWPGYPRLKHTNGLESQSRDPDKIGHTVKCFQLNKMLRGKRETETDTKDAALPAKANRLLGSAFRRQTDTCTELRGQAILHTELNGTTLRAYNVVLPTNKQNSRAQIDLKVPQVS